MKILFSAKAFYPIKGGGERSVYTLLKSLSNNHQIFIVCEGLKNKSFKLKSNLVMIHRKIILKRLTRFLWMKRFLQNLHWKFVLSQFINEIDPDFILTQLEFSLATISLANKYRIPSVLFIRHFFYFCPMGFKSGRSGFCVKNCPGCNIFTSAMRGLKLKEKVFEIFFLFQLVKWNIRTIQNSSLVFSNSQYSMLKIRDFFKRRSEVIHPFIDFLDYKIDKHEEKYITLINPTDIKGVKIFLRIAKELSNMDFLAVGKASNDFENRLKKLKNVKHLDWVEDISEVYAKTSILLVPSIDEPFGRVAVEAMLNGIPVIGSKSGGLPEILHKDLQIRTYHSISEWIKKLYLVKQNYQRYSNEVRNNLSQFNSSSTINKFKEIIRTKLGILI